MKRFCFLLLIVAFLVGMTACGGRMGEEEAREACERSVDCFVGGYLNGSGAKYLAQYAYGSADDMEDMRQQHRISPKNWEANYRSLFPHDLSDRIVSYILSNATFEIDPYSFVYEKGSKRAELDVKITLVRPQAAFDAVYDYYRELAYAQSRSENWAEEFYQYAVSVIDRLPAEIISADMDLIYEDGEWLVDDYWMLPVHLGE